MTPPREPPPPDTTTVNAFETSLLSTGKVRADRETLWKLWSQADPAWARTWAARPRLLNALNTLADAGTIELPSRRGTLWDTASIPLPARITIPANRRREKLLDPAAEPWCPTMNWVPGWIRATRPPQALRHDAATINRWLLAHTGTPPPMIAREERSLDIFNDEKRLAHLTTTPLFAPDRMTLARLSCQAPIGALRIARLKASGPVLILENKSTFDSAWRSLRAADDPGYAAVVFGSGDAVSAIVSDLTELPELLQIQPTFLLYAGDVDIAGIEAAQHATDAASKSGLTCFMSIPLWTAVAQAPPTGEDLTAPAAAQRCTAIETARRLGLPDGVLRHLAEGMRVPQERVDRTRLSDPTWWQP